MPDFQVTCIIKPDRYSSHEHITHIGNVANSWMITREAAIRRIDSKQDTFYTLDNHGRRAEVGVVREQGKQPYLRTYADRVWNDNLLAQQTCPGTCKVIE